MANEKVIFHETPAQQYTGSLPTIYCNGSIVNVGVSDMSALLMLDTSPIMKIHLSYTSAKNLVNALEKGIKLLETATGNEIMLSEEVEKGLRKAAGESKENV